MNAIPPSQAWAILSRHASEEHLHSLPRLEEMRRRRRYRRQQQQQQQQQQSHGDSRDAYDHTNHHDENDDDDNENFIFIHRSTRSSHNQNHENINQKHHHHQQQQQYTLLVDISRHHITNDTLHHLLRYSASLWIKEQIRKLAWGTGGGGNGGGETSRKIARDGTIYWTNGGVDQSRSNGVQDVSFSSSIHSGIASSGGVTFAGVRGDEDEEAQDDAEKNDDTMNRGSSWNSSMHLAYRVPSDHGSFMRDPTAATKPEQQYYAPVNALDEIHAAQSRIQQLSHEIRSGKKRGAHFFGDLPLVDVLVVSGGGGVVTSGVEFVYHTLINGSTSSCTSSYVDPSTLASSSSSSNTVQYVPDASDGAGRGVKKNSSSGSNNNMSMVSTLQSTAGGVINMVTTPFKSVVQRGSGGGDGGGGGIRSLSLSSSLSDIRGPPMTSTSSSFFQSQHPNLRKKWRQRKLKILTSSDPSALNEILSDLEPATTMVITINIDPELDEECCEITSAVKTWLFSGLSPSFSSSSSSSDDEKRRGHVLRHHMYSVTITDASPSSSSSSLSSSVQNVFVLPRHSRCEAFSSFSAAALLPLSIIFGWETISSLLAGAHDIDRHFVDSSPRHNLPIVLALVDFWNDAFLNSNGRFVSTCLGAIQLYPKFVAVLENRVLNDTSLSPPSTSLPVQGKASWTDKICSRGRGIERKEVPSPVIYGGSHYFDIYGGIGRCMNKNLSAEFIMPYYSPITECHQKRICRLLATVDLLAFGADRFAGMIPVVFNASSGFDHIPSSPPMIQSIDSMLSQSSTTGLLGNLPSSSSSLGGNQPSTLLCCGPCDAFTCGQLIALAEHRATVKAWLWNIDPFAITKLSIRKERREHLSERMRQMDLILLSDEETLRGDNSSTPLSDGIHSTTKFILREYAERIS